MFLCFELFKDPIQIPCSNQHVICKMCCDKLFEKTVFVEGRYLSKCYCREKNHANDCVPAKAIARTMNNKYMIFPNSQNGCDWRCDPYHDYSFIRQNHTTNCRKIYDSWQLPYSNQIVLTSGLKLSTRYIPGVSKYKTTERKKKILPQQKPRIAFTKCNAQNKIDWI